MLAKKYLSKIISIANPHEGLYTIEFESLSGKYKYKPGQFIHLAIDEYDTSGAWPESRCFSVQSSPVEDTLKVTYAVKGAFTKRMQQELAAGNEVWLKLPFGDLFTQEHDKNNTVFIAGGTGITPYLSLFTHQSFEDYINPKLYSGFRSEQFHLYKNELAKAKEINASLKSISFYQDTDGIIDIGKIYNDNKDAGSFFISGPPVMIKSFKEYLLAQGIPEGKIKTDDWE